MKVNQSGKESKYRTSESSIPLPKQLSLTRKRSGEGGLLSKPSITIFSFGLLLVYLFSSLFPLSFIFTYIYNFLCLYKGLVVGLQNYHLSNNILWVYLSGVLSLIIDSSRLIYPTYQTTFHNHLWRNTSHLHESSKDLP